MNLLWKWKNIVLVLLNFKYSNFSRLMKNLKMILNSSKKKKKIRLFLLVFNFPFFIHFVRILINDKFFLYLLVINLLRKSLLVHSCKSDYKISARCSAFCNLSGVIREDGNKFVQTVLMHFNWWSILINNHLPPWIKLLW